MYVITPEGMQYYQRDIKKNPDGSGVIRDGDIRIFKPDIIRGLITLYQGLLEKVFSGTGAGPSQQTSHVG